MIAVENDKELETLKQFKKGVQDLDQDDVTCIRFLIARNFDTNQAEEMLRNSVKWRKLVKIDEIFGWDPLPDYIVEDLPFKILGINRLGGPVIWLPLGTWKGRYWVERGKKEEITKYAFYILEHGLQQVRQCGHRRATILFGMEELTYYKVSHLDTLRVLYAGFQALEQNYPEVLQNLIVLNAPWVFTIAFNFIKPILSQRTLDKIQVFGSDKSQYVPRLQELCDDAAIPPQYLY